jgi:hypothetical protein
MLIPYFSYGAAIESVIIARSAVEILKCRLISLPRADTALPGKENGRSTNAINITRKSAPAAHLQALAR